MADEEPAEFDTPWRRSLDEIEPALVGVGARSLRRARRRRERRVARQRHVERDRALRDDNVAEGGVDRYVARLAPLPDLYPVFPEYDLELQRKCMDLVRAAHRRPRARGAFFELDPSGSARRSS